MSDQEGGEGVDRNMTAPLMEHVNIQFITQLG